MAKPLKKSRIFNFLLYTFIRLSLPLRSTDQQQISSCLQKQQKAEKKLYYIENDFSNQDISLKKALFDLKGHELIQLECSAAKGHK